MFSSGVSGCIQIMGILQHFTVSGFKCMLQVQTSSLCFLSVAPHFFQCGDG